MHWAWRDFIKKNGYISLEEFCEMTAKVVSLIKKVRDDPSVPVKKIVEEFEFPSIISSRTKNMNANDFESKIDHMISIFGLDTFCHLFNDVVVTGKDHLYDECLNNLCENVVTIMENDGILKIIKKCTMIHIVSCDRMNLDEETLFEFVVEWIRANNEKNPKNILDKIRFGTMNSKYLTTVVYDANLTPCETIIKIIASKDRDLDRNKRRKGKFSRFWLAPRNAIVPGFRLLTKEDTEMNNFIKRFDQNVEDNKGIKALRTISAKHGSNIYIDKFILRIDDQETYYNENFGAPNSICCINVDNNRSGDIEEVQLEYVPVNELSPNDICIFVRNNVKFDK